MSGRLRDADTVRDALAGWTRRKLDAEVVRVVPAEGGASSETYLIDARLGSGHEENWVLRVEPQGHQIYQDASIRRQFSVISALAASPADLPIPAPVAFEPDASILGARFFLMERATGVAPPNDYHREGVLVTMSAAEREALCLEAIGLLARLHAVEPGPFDFLGFPGSADGIAQELARWESYRSWSRVPDLPVYDRVTAWLEGHRSGGAATGFAWGDARIPNIMIGNGRVTALLDWETASLGGAETDLAWWWFYDRMICEAEGVRRLPGLWDGTQTVTAWESVAGRKAASMEWHLIFAGYRFAMISERARALAIAAGRLPADQWGPANPAVRLLEALLNEHGG